ncbi:MAG: hypothetical protein M3Q45_12160, partial [Chloroflexota bacterium]|nr:hypothetical protein [Chloroflexota bacterium]
HTVTTAYEQGWSGLSNGKLLDAAEQAGYQLLITTDQNLHHQQNLVGRQLAILVLRSTSWSRIQGRIDEIRQAVDVINPGNYTEVPM